MGEGPGEGLPCRENRWVQLRDRRTLGLQFRRQVPIDRYIVDFYCHELRLIVELDGMVHDRPEQAKKDRKRNARLQQLGYRILRITNVVVLRDPDCFAEMIRALLPSPGLRATLSHRERDPAKNSLKCPNSSAVTDRAFSL